MTHDNFDDWFAPRPINKMVQAKLMSQDDLDRVKTALREAWEAGWEAGKLYGEDSERQRQDDIASAG